MNSIASQFRVSRHENRGTRAGQSFLRDKSGPDRKATRLELIGNFSNLVGLE